MAHSGGVIYVDTTTTPNTGVSVYDVQQTLGISSSDVGTLCSSNQINKWSKYKPVALSTLDTTSQLDGNKKWRSNATWWKGASGNCGISVVRTCSTVASAKTDIDSGRTIWSKVAPTGGATEPFRLVDFNEYHNNAMPPVFSVDASNAYLRPGAELKIMIATSVDDGYSIKFSDISAYDNWYYTVAVYGGSELKFIVSADKPIGEYNGGETIEFTIPYNNGTYGYQGKLTEGNTYNAYVFMSSVQYLFTTSEYSGSYSYLPLPCGAEDYGIPAASFTCRADSQWAVVDAFSGSGRLVDWKIRIYGLGQSTTGTVRLIDRQGNVVTGQSFSVDFSNSTAVDPVDGIPGYELRATAMTTPMLPTDNPEAYLLEFVTLNISARAGIGHDIIWD